MIDDGSFWAAASAVLVAFISGVAAPYVAARYKQKSNGSPAERVQVASAAGFGNGTARMAIQIAHEAQDAANKAEEETATVTEERDELRDRVRKLEEQNRRLRDRVKYLRHQSIRDE